ncbi:MAG: hypothetical protein PHU94_03265 [Bacilli bacterium]|nr:hypothetical protein [Bacilli bacterium]
MFKDKLSFLMVITNSTNNDLAISIPLSESCISRWRSGKRRPPKNASYIPNIIDYFYEIIVADKLEYKFNDIDIFNNTDNFKESLEKWLFDKNIVFGSDGIVNYSINSIYYYGDAGKREAVIRFLTNAKNKSNQVLLLYSDESISWMLEEKFVNVWSKLLIEVLKNRNKIKIIHTIAREYNEMFEAVSKWLPLYLTGKIEPYYYSKLRDGIVRRTIFINRDEAITSTSVGNKTDDMLNIYINDRTAVSSLRKEFNNYLTLCKPLMNVITNPEKEKITELLNTNNDNIIIDSYSLSFVSTPDSIITKIFEKNNNEKLIKPFLKRKQLLLSNLKNYTILDIINISLSFDNNIPYSFIKGEFYTKQDYINHLKNIIELLNKNDNYYVILKNVSFSSSNIYIKENTELIIENNENNTLLVSHESNIIKAFWEHYLTHNIESKDNVIKKIQNIIKENN